MKPNIISVSVLKEGLINNERPNNNAFFEESIYLINMKLDRKTKKELVTEIKDKLKTVEISYKNEVGEVIQWKIYKIIDVFDSVYDIDVMDFPNEVYSRHLELSTNSEHEEILTKYFSDYVWEDDL